MANGSGRTWRSGISTRDEFETLSAGDPGSRNCVVQSVGPMKASSAPCVTARSEGSHDVQKRQRKEDSAKKRPADNVEQVSVSSVRSAQYTKPRPKTAANSGVIFRCLTPWLKKEIVEVVGWYLRNRFLREWQVVLVAGMGRRLVSIFKTSVA